MSWVIHLCVKEYRLPDHLACKFMLFIPLVLREVLTIYRTEAGLVAESISRPKGDPYWNYMRFFDNFLPFIWMKPINDSLYECVYLRGHPALTSSNSDDPPGSYYSRDVFTPHPTIPGRWKYVTRLDDRVNLVNGEKVLPLPIEGTIKQDPLVQEAVVVGVGKTVPGLMVFRSEEAKDLSDDEYLNAIWPSIEDANSRAEKFSQITREMVVVLPHTAPCPRTDKGSLIRAQAYTQYAEVIENLYTNLEQAADGTLELDLPATRDHLMRLVQGELGLSISSANADLFAEGVDSLKAIHLRRLILRDYKIPGNNALGQNVVFETGTIARLAEYIHNLQSGKQITIEDEVSSMSGMIEKYSSFQQHTPNFGSTSKKTAVCTAILLPCLLSTNAFSSDLDRRHWLHGSSCTAQSLGRRFHLCGLLSHTQSPSQGGAYGSPIRQGTSRTDLQSTEDYRIKQCPRQARPGRWESHPQRDAAIRIPDHPRRMAGQFQPTTIQLRTARQGPIQPLAILPLSPPVLPGNNLLLLVCFNCVRCFFVRYL